MKKSSVSSSIDTLPDESPVTYSVNDDILVGDTGFSCFQFLGESLDPIFVGRGFAYQSKEAFT